MTRHALLNNVEHKDLRVITERAAKYGDRVMSCPALTVELRRLQAWYPVLFQPDAKGEFFPRALFGFQRGENLFLDDSGWRAGYIPAMIRREPFLIGMKRAEDGGENTRMLSIDLDHPRVSKAEGEPLFQPLGGNTPFLEETANLMETIYRGLEHTRSFAAELHGRGLLETVNLEITLQDGSRNQLTGYHGINEEKVRELDGPVLKEFSNRGFLLPLFMVMASLSSVQRLIELKNAEGRMS